MAEEEGGDGGAAATFPSRIPSPLVIPDPTGPEACGRGGDLQGKGDGRIDPAPWILDPPQSPVCPSSLLPTYPPFQPPPPPLSLLAHPLSSPHLAGGERGSGGISWRRQWGRARLQGDGPRWRWRSCSLGRGGAREASRRRAETRVQGSGWSIVTAGDGRRRCSRVEVAAPSVMLREKEWASEASRGRNWVWHHTLACCLHLKKTDTSSRWTPSGVGYSRL